MNLLPEYYTYSRPDIQRLVPQDARRILDIGCAAGALGHALKQKTGAEVWGVEYVPEAAALAAERLDRVLTGKIEDVLPQLPDTFFDVIICADVLEHLIDPWQVLSCLRGKLAAGGKVVASIPNVRHWSVIKGLLEGSWRYEEAGILDRNHLRFFTWHSCQALFSSTGFTITSGTPTMLNTPACFPEAIAIELKKTGLHVDTLVEESRYYQFLVVATPDEHSVRPLTSIIVLTWNQLPCTQECLASIAAFTSEPYELIVVDNGSTDGTVAWLQQQAHEDQRIRIITNDSNLGFAKGCNQGIEAAHGEYILLLNNDVVVTAEWLTGLLECYRRKSHVGIVGPMTNNISGIQRVAHADYDDIAGMHDFAQSFRGLNRYRMIENRRVVGFCMLFSKQLANEVGLLDETFGSGNFEDDDYCLRVELAGYRNFIAGDVFIHHYGSQTFIGNKLAYGQAMQHNMALYRQKWDYKQLDQGVLHRLAPLDAVIESRRLAQRGDVDQAINVLMQKGIKAAPDNPAPYEELVELLLRVGRYDDVLQLLPQMPAAANPELKFEFAAICHCALGDAAAAQKTAQQAGRHHRSLVVLGALAARQEKQAEAEHLFRQAIDADPSCSSGWLSLGMLLWGQGQQADAWQAVQRAATVDPLHTEALAIFSDMAERLNRQTDVCLLLDQAIQLYPLSRQLAMQHAQVLSRTGQHGEALAACERFLVQFGVDEGLLALALELRERSGAYDRLQQGGSESVSLCMIVKNEEDGLARCLASAKPIVHEMIVVDTGSSDATVAIATAFGAKLHHFLWNGNFSDARNHSLDQASGAWVLVLDADEVIANQDYPKIQQAVLSATAHKAAWSVLTRNYTPKVHAQGWTANDGSYPAEERAGGWHPSTKVRLFPALPTIRFSGEIHEMVEPSLQATGIPFQQADFVVHHYGELKDGSAAVQKKQRYYALGKEKLLNSPDTIAALIELGVQAGELGLYQEAIDYWDRVLAIDPVCVQALFNKGFALMGLKRYAEALELARETLRLEPLYKEAGFNYGTCALYAGDPAEALQHLDSLAKRYPDHPPLLAISVVLCLADNQLSKAQQCHAKLAAMRYAIDDYVAERAEVLRGQPNRALADVILANWQQVKAQ